MSYLFAKSLIVNQIRLFRLFFAFSRIFPPFSLFQRIRLLDFSALAGTWLQHSNYDLLYSLLSLNFTCNAVEVDKADALKSWVCKVSILATPCLEELPDFKL